MAGRSGLGVPENGGASPFESRGTTVWAWFDLTYYDGLLTFAQGCYRGAGPVVFCGERLPRVR